MGWTTYQVVQDFFHQQYCIIFQGLKKLPFSHMFLPTNSGRNSVGWSPTQLMRCWEASHIGARFQMA